MDILLHKDDFVYGPISIDQIEANLYLGGLSAAKDINTLNQYKITHILTIDTCPLPRKILELKHLTIKFINLSDQAKEDILSYFAESEAFIEQAISAQQQGVVLVHCYFGVSRSATIILAYIMKKYQLDYKQALERVRLKRSIIRPNSGFVKQLYLYYKMGYCIDTNNMHYKKFRLSIAADHVKRVKILPQKFLNVIQSDPSLIQTQPEPNVYRCKKCRRILASESNLLTHKKQNYENEKNDCCMETCKKIYFIEPLSWMMKNYNIQNNTDGKLYCPKCNTKLGSFSWIMGCQCPCGRKVAPAFYLTPSKVDFTDVVKNVEMTF